MTSMYIKNIESCRADVTLQFVCESKIFSTLAQRQCIAYTCDLEKSRQVYITANSKIKRKKKSTMCVALALCHVRSYKRKIYSITNFKLQVPLL